MTIRLLTLFTLLSACTRGRSPATAAAPAVAQVSTPTPATAPPAPQDTPWHPALTLLEDSSKYSMKTRTDQSAKLLPCTPALCGPALQARLLISELLGDPDPDGFYGGIALSCYDYQPTFLKSNMQAHTKDNPFVPATGFSCAATQYIGPEDPLEYNEGLWELKFGCSQLAGTEARCQLTWIGHNGDESGRTTYSFRTDKQYTTIIDGEVLFARGWPDYSQ